MDKKGSEMDKKREGIKTVVAGGYDNSAVGQK